jgi:transcriptional regulator GlxA family with amidase domain
MFASRTVSLFAFPNAEVLDITGPLEVFAQANRFLDAAGDTATPRYRPELLISQGETIRCSGGLSLVADGRIGDARGKIDTLLLAGGAGVHAAAQDGVLLAWVVGQAEEVRRLGSICTGAFLLAAAGLLDGRRATTHWRSCALLAERYPTVRVEPDAIWVQDGAVYSSAGVTAGMDLALALVEEDCGAPIALEIARNLVLYLRRAGGQSQFSAHLLGQAARTPPIQALRDWILANLNQPLGVPDLAARAAMSPRNFARVFAAEIGMTPARFVERARVDAVRQALDGMEPLAVIADRVGFPSADTMRRAFLRALGITPQDYRDRFAG